MFQILLAENDRSLRKQLKSALESENYSVYIVSDGEEALSFLEHRQIDLVVTDTGITNPDGHELTRLLREGDCRLPILVISEAHGLADRKLAYTAGADDFMALPLDPEELILHVKALLRRAGLLFERRIMPGNMVLDYDSMTVSGNGEVQELPQKEFLLLYKLLSEPGKIFTRNRLMDEIWGTDSASGWETLTVHVGRLRKRFTHWKTFEIIAIRGLGYKAVLLPKGGRGEEQTA